MAEEFDFYQRVSHVQENTMRALEHLMDARKTRSVTVQFMPDGIDTARVEVIRARDGEMLSHVLVHVGGNLTLVEGDYGGG